MKCKYSDKPCEFRIKSDGKCWLAKRKHKMPCEYDFQKLLKITLNPRNAYKYAQLMMEKEEREIPKLIFDAFNKLYISESEV